MLQYNTFVGYYSNKLNYEDIFYKTPYDYYFKLVETTFYKDKRDCKSFNHQFKLILVCFALRIFVKGPAKCWLKCWVIESFQKQKVSMKNSLDVTVPTECIQINRMCRLKTCNLPYPSKKLGRYLVVANRLCKLKTTWGTMLSVIIQRILRTL